MCFAFQFLSSVDKTMPSGVARRLPLFSRIPIFVVTIAGMPTSFQRALSRSEVPLMKVPLAVFRESKL